MGERIRQASLPSSDTDLKLSRPNALSRFGAKFSGEAGEFGRSLRCSQNMRVCLQRRLSLQPLLRTVELGVS